ncbi:MAG: ribosome silencing factor [Elusimicrobia bacterium]|nr:ribosome silencing factor [Elusimicrobiota bacterium]
MPQGFKSIAILAAQAADKKKGEDILVIDTRRRSSLSDYILLVNIQSPAQLEAVESEVRKSMEAAGVTLVHHDGGDSVLWRVLDYGGLLVHLMHPQAREFYSLEKLYEVSTRTGRGKVARARLKARA